MKFEFEFEDLSPRNGITFDYSDECEEEMRIVIENGVPVIYANKQAYMTLAKAFIKMACGNYSDGFHFHLHQNFDGDEEEAIRCHVQHFG